MEKKNVASSFTEDLAIHFKGNLVIVKHILIYSFIPLRIFLICPDLSSPRHMFYRLNMTWQYISNCRWKE